MSDIWTIASILEWMQGYLKSHNDPNPRLSSQWLISFATGLSRMELYTSFDRPLSSEELDCLRSAVKRRAAGEPLQYITGEAPFRYLTIKVSPGVLIPRPETEVLVSELLSVLPKPDKVRASEYLNESATSSDDLSAGGDVVIATEPPSSGSEQPILVADLCTGSGCIACALAFEHPKIEVIATDISHGAVEQARANVLCHDLDERVDVIECDLGSGIDQKLMGSFDAVISNPPYIPTSELGALSNEVAGFEPKVALDGGQDGLDIFRRIMMWSLDALKDGGVVAVELHETKLDEARRAACDAGFVEVEIKRDLADKPRILIARKRMA